MSLKSAFSVSVLGLLMSSLAPAPAVAATASASFAVTATVEAGCQVSANAMTFGTYAGVVASAASPVSVTCSNSAPYNVDLSAGMAAGATVAARTMTGPGAALLGYALSSNPRGIVNWGQTVGRDTVTGSGNGTAEALSVHDQIAAGRYFAAGAHADSITVTVTY
jgi:spore coat protein U-like protein